MLVVVDGSLSASLSLQDIISTLDCHHSQHTAGQLLPVTAVIILRLGPCERYNTCRGRNKGVVPPATHWMWTALTLACHVTSRCFECLPFPHQTSLPGTLIFHSVVMLNHVWWCLVDNTITNVCTTLTEFPSVSIRRQHTRNVSQLHCPRLNCSLERRPPTTVASRCRNRRNSPLSAMGSGRSATSRQQRWCWDALAVTCDSWGDSPALTTAAACSVSGSTAGMACSQSCKARWTQAEYKQNNQQFP